MVRKLFAIFHHRDASKQLKYYDILTQKLKYERKKGEEMIRVLSVFTLKFEFDEEGPSSHVSSKIPDFEA